MEQEWYIGALVSPIAGRMPVGIENDEIDLSHLYGKIGDVTDGWHDVKDPSSAIQFKVHGWYWYAHDLEARHA